MVGVIYNLDVVGVNVVLENHSVRIEKLHFLEVCPSQTETLHMLTKGNFCSQPDELPRFRATKLGRGAG